MIKCSLLPCISLFLNALWRMENWVFNTLLLADVKSRGNWSQLKAEGNGQGKASSTEAEGLKCGASVCHTTAFCAISPSLLYWKLSLKFGFGESEYSLETTFLSFFFFFFFRFWLPCSLWKFLGQGSNLSQGYDLGHSCSNAGSLSHCAEPGMELAPPTETSPRSLIHCTTVGTPKSTFLVILSLDQYFSVYRRQDQSNKKWFSMGSQVWSVFLGLKILSGIPALAQWVKNPAEVWVWFPTRHRGLKDPALVWLQNRSQLWLVFSPWPRNFHMLWVRPLKKKQQRKTKKPKKHLK